VTLAQRGKPQEPIRLTLGEGSMCTGGPRFRKRYGRALQLLWSAVVVFALLAPQEAAAQIRSEVTPELLERVMPEADRFSLKEGDPPVMKAYRTDPVSGAETLIGYAFLTSDAPPEAVGYNNPIDVLVGMSLDAKLTGIAVVGYDESLSRTRGDFLARRSFQNQFAGKDIVDAFRVRRDVDGITGATITVAAMSIGIRNAARRVAAAYLSAPNAAADDRLTTDMKTIGREELSRLTWAEMLQRGLGDKITTNDGSQPFMDLSLIYIRDAEIAEVLLGSESWESVRDGVAAALDAGHLMVVGLDGPQAFAFRPPTLFFVQAGDTIRLNQDDFTVLGPRRDGLIEGEFRRHGLLVVSRRLDVSRPYTIALDLRPRMEVFTTEHIPVEGGSPRAPPIAIEAGREPDTAMVGGELGEEPEAIAAGSSVDSGAIDLTGAEVAASAGLIVPPEGTNPFAFSEAELEETLFERTLAQTSWYRVGFLLLLLIGTTVAFLAKTRTSLRWGVLASTLIYLGFIDRGFLSVSHITAGITAGPSVYLSDVPLLLIATFTVVSTLLAGRVFCGFLCPFGALQDFITRVVPRRWQREVPRAIHERALLAKYVVLPIVLLPAVIGSQESVFQYFEPFGTVFFFSRSMVLWAIAAAILAATVVVPRFYCRYMCPLGAALAIGSLLSPFRIRRVEQCRICKVCEQKCPTGAIRGEKVNFKECVRCNLCETKLIEKAGVCRHDIEVVRPRLVKLTMGSQEAVR